MSKQHILNFQHDVEPQKIGADPNFSVFLSASAGTGKTKVLCDRFLNLVKNGADPTKIMCITFTNSAADEMLDRIMTLSQSLMPNDEINCNKNNVYTKILFNKHHLKIKTIHAFCLEILTTYNKLYGHENRRLIDNVLKQQTIDEIFTNLSKNFMLVEEKVKQSFIDLSEHFSNSKIADTVNQVISKSSEFEEYLKKYNTNLREHIFSHHQAHENFDYTKEQSDYLNIFKKTVASHLHDVKLIDKNADLLLAALDSCNYQKLINTLLTKKGEVRKLFYSKKIQQKSPLLADIIGKLQISALVIEQTYKNFVFANLNFAFINLSAYIFNQYKNFKKTTRYLDYEDIITQVINLIEEDPAVLYNLDYKIDHILVDEAQDLSEKQWSLIYCLSGEFFAGIGVRGELKRTLFVVGDFKQSIFSFQGAKPHLFKYAANNFLSKVHDVNLWKQIEMNKSFRSEKNILRLVNKIFPNVFENFVDHHYHKASEGHIEIWPLITIKALEKQDGWCLPSADIVTNNAYYELADFIANTINKWLMDGRLLNNQSIKPSDIMILIKKRSEYVDILVAKLRKKGLDVTTPKLANFTEDIIVMDLMAIANFLICPDDDLELAALLKSPFFNLKDDELFELCHLRKSTLLDSIALKKLTIKSALDEIRDVFRELPISQAYYEILFGLNYYENFHNRFGQAAKISIDNFLEAVSNFETINSAGGFESLLNYLYHYEPNANYMLEDNSIRIMTVHAAKGLQAPIVIIADGGSSEETTTDEAFFYEGEIYFSVGSEYRSAVFDQMQKKMIQASLEENKRLLYVAITRAESELYVAGVKGNKFESSWYNIIKQYADETMKQPYVYSSQKIKKIGDVSLQSFTSKSQLVRNTQRYEIKSLAVLEGDIIHEILEKLCELEDQAIVNYIELVKQKYKMYFTNEKIDEFYNEARAVADKFPELFTHNILCEQATIAGLNNGNTNVYRIDRMVFLKNKILIVDFKTDHNPPSYIDDIKSDYLIQIRNYLDIIKSIYPSYLVEGAILWTKRRELKKVSLNH